MSGKDRNEKKIHADNIRITNTIRNGRASKEKPTEKVEKYFRRKAYEQCKKEYQNGKEKGCK